MNKVNIATTIKTKTETIISLNDKDLFELLNSYLDIPSNATDIEIYVAIPGGGDWSNMNLNIDKDNEIIIRYKTIKVDQSNDEHKI